jgi:hypothetical protein
VLAGLDKIFEFGVVSPSNVGSALNEMACYKSSG